MVLGTWKTRSSYLASRGDAVDDAGGLGRVVAADVEEVADVVLA